MPFVFVHVSHWIIICGIDISYDFRDDFAGIRTRNFLVDWGVSSQHSMFYFEFQVLTSSRFILQKRDKCVNNQ